MADNNIDDPTKILFPGTLCCLTKIPGFSDHIQYFVHYHWRVSWKFMSSCLKILQQVPCAKLIVMSDRTGAYSRGSDETLQCGGPTGLEFASNDQLRAFEEIIELILSDVRHRVFWEMDRNLPQERG